MHESLLILTFAKIKEDVLIFFNLSSANQMKDKKIFKKALENLVKANTYTQNNILREVLKIHNGKGAFNDLPPDDFSAQISDEKNGKPCLSSNVLRK